MAGVASTNTIEANMIWLRVDRLYLLAGGRAFFCPTEIRVAYYDAKQFMLAQDLLHSRFANRCNSRRAFSAKSKVKFLRCSNFCFNPAMSSYIIFRGCSGLSKAGRPCHSSWTIRPSDELYSLSNAKLSCLSLTTEHAA